MCVKSVVCVGMWVGVLRFSRCGNMWLKLFVFSMKWV